MKFEKIDCGNGIAVCNINLEVALFFLLYIAQDQLFK